MIKYHGDIIIDPTTYAKFYYPGADRFYSPSHAESGEGHDVDDDPMTLASVHEPQDFGGGSIWKHYDIFDPSDDGRLPLDEKHFFLFPKKIHGISLKDKQWSESFLFLVILALSSFLGRFLCFFGPQTEELRRLIY